MMAKKKRILSSLAVMPRLPLWGTLVTGTCLHYWNAPGWVWGVLGTLYMVVWINWVWHVAQREQVHPFDTNDESKEYTNWLRFLKDTINDAGKL